MSGGAGEQMRGGEKALERYLNSACTGLYGLERQTVRGELEANLFERVREFQVMGFAREVALEKTFEEFGAPSRVSRGMREVYIMPKIIKGGALAGFLAMGVYLAVGSSVAGPVPISLCMGVRIELAPGQSSLDCTSLLALLKLEDIRADFAKQGFTLEADEEHFRLVREGQALFDLKWANPTEVVKRVDGKNYINLNSLFALDDTQYVRVPVRFDRLLDPTLDLGGAKLRPTSALGKNQVDITVPVAWRIAFFLRQAIDPKMQSLGYGNAVSGSNRSYSFMPERKFNHTLEQVGKSGKVYALAWIREGMTVLSGNKQDRVNAFIETALATADAQGTLKFATTLPRLEFTDSLQTFKQALGKKAILLELTGRLDNAAPAFTLVKNPPRSSQSN